MTKARAVKAVLLAAARLIERRGWCQGTYERRGRLCVLGALSAAGGGRPVYYRATERLSKTIGELYLATWNDRPGMTRTAVIAALRKAAK